MKTKIYALLVLSLPLLASCFDDEGNYDYKEPLNIQVGGMQEEYTVNPTDDVLRLSPQITPVDREYEYFWTIAPSTATNINLVDTISKEKDLNYAVNLSIGTYKLRFCAKDTKTGVFALKEYTVYVTTDMATGWWVIKTEDDETDIDFFSTNKVKEDIIYAANGRKLQGTALNLHFTPYFWVFNESTQTEVTANTVFVASTGDVVALDYFSGKIYSDYEDLFIEQPAHRTVSDMFAGPSDVHVYVDNTVYTMFNSRSVRLNQFVIKSMGDYQLSSQKLCSHSTLPLLFDEKASSFCSVSRNSATLDYFADGNPSPLKMNMDMIFMGGQSRAANQQGDVAKAIMQKKGAKEYYLMTLNGHPSYMSQNPLQSVTALGDTIEVLQADYRALNQNNDIIYFSKDNRIYSCNLDTEKETEQDIVIGIGEEITYMEFIKYAPYNMSDLWFDYLAIATTKDGRYKLSLHPVSAGRLLPAEKTFEGKGRVKRACYMEQATYGIYTSTLF